MLTKGLDMTALAWSQVRFAQTGYIGHLPNTLMPNTFMAVTYDLPDLDPEHIKHDISA